MERISWTDTVSNEEVFHRIKLKKNIVRKIKEGRVTRLVTSCFGTASMGRC